MSYITRDGSIDQSKQAIKTVGSSVGLGGFALSAGSGTLNITSTSGFTSVTGALTLVCGGNPIRMGLMADPVATIGSAGSVLFATAGMYARFIRDSSVVLGVMSPVTSSANVGYAPSVFSDVDFPTAGTHTYLFQIQLQSSGTVTVRDVMFWAHEL